MDVIDLGAARRRKQPAGSWPAGREHPGLGRRADDRLSLRASFLLVGLASGLLWAGIAAVIGAMIG